MNVVRCASSVSFVPACIMHNDISTATVYMIYRMEVIFDEAVIHRLNQYKYYLCDPRDTLRKICMIAAVNHPVFNDCALITTIVAISIWSPSYETVMITIMSMRMTKIVIMSMSMSSFIAITNNKHFFRPWDWMTVYVVLIFSSNLVSVFYPIRKRGNFFAITLLASSPGTSKFIWCVRATSKRVQNWIHSHLNYRAMWVGSVHNNPWNTRVDGK